MLIQKTDRTKILRFIDSIADLDKQITGIRQLDFITENSKEDAEFKPSLLMLQAMLKTFLDDYKGLKTAEAI